MKLDRSVIHIAGGVLSIATLAACGGGGGGSSAAGSGVVAVVGTDVTGTYRAIGVECYNNTLSTLTAVASIAAGYTETLTINKNAYEVTINTTGCSSRENGRLVYNSTDYTAALTNRTTTTASQGTCSHAVNFSASLGSVSPNSFTAAVNHNGTEVDRTVSAFKSTSTGAIGIFSTIQVVGSPSDLCFLVYQQI
ncbi:MAG: hypothetical protein U1E10_01530 [Bdellovibrionales bacterium]|nr:hypothetical protein [Bdellovibrionales bacterium]